MKTIALCPGSFDPFHIGHLNILEKSERIFGKGNVVVAMGVNIEKQIDDDGFDDNNHLIIIDKEWNAKELKKKINREVIVYTNFLHELVEKYEAEGFNVVIVRGLRNGADLDYEVNQKRWVDDFKKDINYVYITCDKDFEHISSSAIRKLEKFSGEKVIKKYLPK